MISSGVASEVQKRLNRIQTLATEIEKVPNFGPDLWSMRKIDKECQEIRQHCQEISILIGTGDAGTGTGSGTGTGH